MIGGQEAVVLARQLASFALEEDGAALRASQVHGRMDGLLENAALGTLPADGRVGTRAGANLRAGRWTGWVGVASRSGDVDVDMDMDVDVDVDVDVYVDVDVDVDVEVNLGHPDSLGPVKSPDAPR